MSQTIPLLPTNPATAVGSAKGRLARASALYGAESVEVAERRRDLAAAKIAQYIERVVADAPPLTDSQRSRLAALLTGGASR